MCALWRVAAVIATLTQRANNTCARSLASREYACSHSPSGHCKNKSSDTGSTRTDAAATRRPKVRSSVSTGPCLSGLGRDFSVMDGHRARRSWRKANVAVRVCQHRPHREETWSPISRYKRKLFGQQPHLKLKEIRARRIGLQHERAEPVFYNQAITPTKEES